MYTYIHGTWHIVVGLGYPSVFCSDSREDKATPMNTDNDMQQTEYVGITVTIVEWWNSAACLDPDSVGDVSSGLTIYRYNL